MVVEQLQGKHGANITLPNMLGIKGNREGKAADGVPFMAWDFIVHPETLLRCTGNLTLMDFLITTVRHGCQHYLWHPRLRYVLAFVREFAPTQPQGCKAVCCLPMQAVEKLEEATLVKLLRKHKMLAVQYKGVAGQQRCGQHACSIKAALTC
jgi:hypothetical protein